jgi:hypothetical protein
MDINSQDLFFYYKVFKYEHKPITLVTDHEIDANGKVVAYAPDSKKYLEENYNTHVIESYGSVTVYKLNGTKE